MTNEEFIRLHREADVRRLALRRAPEGIDLKWCLQQIEGWQLARRKLPRWAATEGLWYPPRLALEQCSSQETAQYKADIVHRLIPAARRQSMADLTGGLGADFSQLAPLFCQAAFVELQPDLLELARHNLPLLGIKNAVTLSPVQSFTFSPFQLVYIDPARRDTAGRKTVRIQDCTPDLLALQDQLLPRCRWLMAKLSPMLDITQALRALKNVREVHVVSLHGECKELLFLMEGVKEEEKEGTPPLFHCVNLGTDEEPLTYGPPSDGPSVGLRPSGQSIVHCQLSIVNYPLSIVNYPFLYEPNASILKAGLQDVLPERYPVRKLHPMSHLFVSDRPVPRFPGRRFRILGFSDFSRQSLRDLLAGLRQANLSVRNFPASVATLRRQLKLREGGHIHLFATTAGDGSHILIKAQRTETAT